MSESERFTRRATVALIICIAALTAAVVKREFFPTQPPNPTGRSQRVSAAEWRIATSAGKRIGPTDAAVTVVEFSDFQCPWCARFARHVVAGLRHQYPNDVAFIYRHLPLKSIHPHAYAAALASECAAEQGRFEDFHDRLFFMPDSIGPRSFAAFARDAHVADDRIFQVCLESTANAAVVDRDLADAKRLNVRATPTIFANGWRLAGLVDSTRLDSLVRAEMKKARALH
jgi:protein-disulfide isomerase